MRILSLNSSVFNVGTIVRRFFHRQSPRQRKVDLLDAYYRDMKKGEEATPVSAAASNVSITVLQNGSFGFHRSVCVSTDHVSYMFNCPETNRRVLSEQGVRRPPSIKHVFFTHGSWQNAAGVPGLVACLRSLDIDEIRLHGPPGLTKITKVTNPFDGKFQHVLYQEKPVLEDEGLATFEDSNVVIEAVPFSVSPNKEKVVLEYLENRTATNKDEPFPLHSNDLAVAYVCTLKPKWGKIILDKCVELGVKIGPDVGRLQRGRVVTNSHGREVHPDEVREQPLPPEHFGVVDCPNEQFLESLLRSRVFSKFYAADGGSDFKLLVHFSPSHIMETNAYRDWMNQFPRSTIHWICNDSAPSISHLNGSLRAQSLLNSLHADIFPLLWHHRIAAQDDGCDTNLEKQQATDNVIMAKPFTRFLIRPSIGIQPLFYGDDDDERQPKERTNVQLEKFRRETAQMDLSGEIFPTVTFFGTAASSPTKHRNVSCICLHLREGASILLDCGESSISQMRLYYGKDCLERRLAEIKAVFVSHLHLDHHFGLYSLILERKLAFEKLQRPYEKLLIIAAAPLRNAHSEFSKFIEDTDGLYDFRSTAADPTLSTAMSEVAEKLGLRKIDVVKVIHPQCATGFVLTTDDGKKVVYSGDTRPCENLVKAGRDADLLIHEATLNDGREQDAIFKKHCTKSEALAVSRAMNAKWTILTHFTGLNSKLPYIDERLMREYPNVGMAYDFMTVQWRQLPLLPKLIPVLYELYEEHYIAQEGIFSRKRVTIGHDDDDDSVASKVARSK